MSKMPYIMPRKINTIIFYKYLNLKNSNEFEC